MHIILCILGWLAAQVGGGEFPINFGIVLLHLVQVVFLDMSFPCALLLLSETSLLPGLGIQQCPYRYVSHDDTLYIIVAISMHDLAPAGFKVVQHEFMVCIYSPVHIVHTMCISVISSRQRHCVVHPTCIRVTLLRQGRHVLLNVLSGKSTAWRQPTDGVLSSASASGAAMIVKLYCHCYIEWGHQRGNSLLCT